MFLILSSYILPEKKTACAAEHAPTSIKSTSPIQLTHILSTVVVLFSSTAGNRRPSTLTLLDEPGLNLSRLISRRTTALRRMNVCTQNTQGHRQPGQNRYI